MSSRENRMASRGHRELVPVVLLISLLSGSVTAAPSQTHKLTITKSGTGDGTANSSPGGIRCGTDCEEDYPEGTTVFLGGRPNSGSELTAWTGDADCTDAQVTMSQDLICNAVFNVCSGRLWIILSNTAVSGTWSVCNWMIVGPNLTVPGGGHASLHAGHRVVFESGVTIENDARLSVVTNQPMPPPPE